MSIYGTRTMRIGRICIALCAAAIAFAGCGKPAGGQAVSGGQATPAGGQAGASQAGQQGQRGGGRRMAIVPVQAVQVMSGVLAVDRNTAGSIMPVVQSQVAAQVAGVVSKVNKLSGDWVKTGDVVVQLDDSQLKLSLANAQAALDNAKINLAIGQDNVDQANPKLSLQVQSAQSALDSAQKFYDAQKALYDLGGLSASALDTAASQLTAAQANLEGAKSALDQNNKSGDQTIAQLKLAVTQSQNQLDQAKLNLQYASIRAPFAGQIAGINVQPGMYAGLNTPTFTLVSADREINFNVPPSDASTLPIGTQVFFSYGGKDYPIAVRQAPSAPINGVVPMVGSTGGLDLPYGTVGNVVYKIRLAQGILVPMAALATLEDHNFVFAIVNGKAVVKNITIVAEGGTTAVVDGISPGDTIVVSPPPGLIEGSQVQQTMLAIDAQGNVTQTPGSQSAKTPSASGNGAEGAWQGGKGQGKGVKGQGGPSAPAQAGNP